MNILNICGIIPKANIVPSKCFASDKTAPVSNSGSSEAYYPTSIPTVVGVSSVNQNLDVSSFSQKNSSVMVTDPGEKVLSIGDPKSTLYKTGSSTSFAYPHVAAFAVRLGVTIYNNMTLNPNEIKKLTVNFNCNSIDFAIKHFVFDDIENIKPQSKPRKWGI